MLINLIILIFVCDKILCKKIEYVWLDYEIYSYYLMYD